MLRAGGGLAERDLACVPVMAGASGTTSSNERRTMPTREPRKPRNPELAKAASSLGDAAQHLRNAVQGKIQQLRDTAAGEIAKAKAALLRRTNLAQDRVETVLKTTEARLHEAFVGAQNALDKAVAQAEKRSRAATLAKKAAVKRAPARKAAPAKKATRAR
jgi:hypothetical protein